MMAEPSIIYVEDDPGSRTVMDILVRQMMGIPHLTIFSDSADFIERVEALEREPDLFLLDIHVAPLDGFQLLQMLRAHPAYGRRPVIALTASVMNEEIQQLKNAGFDGVIAKPIKIDTFPMLIERILCGEHVWMIVS